MTADLRAVLVRYGVDPEKVPTSACDLAGTAPSGRPMRCFGGTLRISYSGEQDGGCAGVCPNCHGTGRVPDGTTTLEAALEAWASERERADYDDLAAALNCEARRVDAARETLRRWRVRLRVRVANAATDDEPLQERVAYRAYFCETHVEPGQEHMGAHWRRPDVLADSRMVARRLPIAGPKGPLP